MNRVAGEGAAGLLPRFAARTDGLAHRGVLHARQAWLDYPGPVQTTTKSLPNYD